MINEMRNLENNRDDDEDQNQQDRGGSNKGENMRNQNDSGGSRGLGAMDKDKARDIQSKGGQEVSKDREHMADIGRKGGENSRGNRGQDRNAS